MKLIELYRFTMGSEIWTYTSGNESVTYNSEIYSPVSMGRGNVETKNEISKASVDVNIDIDDQLSQRLITSFDEKVLGLVIYQQDQESLTTNVNWKGRLSSTKPNGNKLNLVFESVFTSLRRPGLRARYQKTCRHVLYGSGCNLDFNNFETAGRALSISGTVINVSEAALQADGYYIGGMIKTNDGVFGYIVDHVGAFITLQRQIDSLIEQFSSSGYGQNYGGSYGGVQISLYPGCDRLRQTCLNKFNNLNNFGGFPWIPSRNPMDGSSIV